MPEEPSPLESQSARTYVCFFKLKSCTAFKLCSELEAHLSDFKLIPGIPGGISGDSEGHLDTNLAGGCGLDAPGCFSITCLCLSPP